MEVGDTHVPPPVWGDDSYAAGRGLPPRPPYHGFPKCRILCPDIRYMFSSALPPFQKDVTTRLPHQLTFKTVSRAKTTELSFYSEVTVSLHALRCSACTEMHRVLSSRIEYSIFSVRSASLFTVLSCRLFRCIYTPHSGYQTFVRL